MLRSLGQFTNWPKARVKASKTQYDNPMNEPKTMTETTANQAQIAKGVADGIDLHNHQQAVGAVILLMILLFPVVWFFPVLHFIGIPLLLLFIFNPPRPRV